MKCSKRDHITPLLKELNWLPVHARIEYKVIVLTFKCLNNLAPSYLADLLTHYRPAFLISISIIHPDYDFKYVLLKFYVTSLIYIFILVCTAIQNTLWMDRYINVLNNNNNNNNNTPF